jgi:hypothetical protein
MEWSQKSKEKLAVDALMKHKKIYDLYAKCGEIVNFYPEVQDEVLKAVQVFDPHYHYNSRCPICVAEFLHHAYHNILFKTINEPFT